MVERINLAGLVCDAETPLDQLIVDSNNPAFRAWFPETGEIEVLFETVNTNPSGEALSQPLQLSLSDGEDSNSGTLNVMVIENGAPRWASLPPMSFDEGGSDSLILTTYLSDTDTDGTSVSPMGLSLSVVDVGNSSLITADFNGHTINIDAIDYDAFGSTIVTIRASDSDGQFADTQLVVHIANVNDAPTLDVSSFEGLRIKVAPFMLRRVKDEVAKELPPKTEQILHVPLGPVQRELYDQVRALTKQRVLDAIGRKGHSCGMTQRM